MKKRNKTLQKIIYYLTITTVIALTLSAIAIVISAALIAIRYAT